jgi:hypothetical protein
MRCLPRQVCTICWTGTNDGERAVKRHDPHALDNKKEHHIAKYVSHHQILQLIGHEVLGDSLPASMLKLRKVGTWGQSAPAVYLVQP